MLQLLRNWRVRRARFNAAVQFNRTNTYTASRPGQWMCPSCGSVHERTSSSAFTGPNFPACCGFAAGHRLNKEHATGVA